MIKLLRGYLYYIKTILLIIFLCSFKKSRTRQEELARGRLAQRRSLLKQKHMKGSIADDAKIVEENLMQEAENDQRG